MSQYKTFQSFWEEYSKRSFSDRQKYFKSLSKQEQDKLISDFLKNGWNKVIAQNILDEKLDLIKVIYSIDLIDLRIQAIKLHKISLIEKETWDQIESIILEFDGIYNTDIIFGGLVVSLYGKQKQFYKIRYQGQS